jgi:heme-degrading monooxygenase HmoA
MTTHYQPGKLDEALRIERESILPELREHAGHQGTIELLDRSRHKMVIISLWQTKADVEAAGGSHSHPKVQARLAKISHHFAPTPPVFESYECERHPVIG